MPRRIRTLDANNHHLPICTVVVKGILPTLIPFVICTAAFFYSQTFMKLYPELVGCLKVTPICLLAFHTIYRGRSPSRYKYHISAGLAASTVGDYYLVWKDQSSFLCGMTAFALAHMLYIRAFGFERHASAGLLTSSALGVSVTLLLWPQLNSEVLCFAVPVYMTLISLTFWTASARLEPSFDWTKAAAACGAFFVAVSDLNLALNAFYLTHPYDKNHLLTMIFYYLGQLGIALSTVDRKEMVDAHLKRETS